VGHSIKFHKKRKSLAGKGRKTLIVALARKLLVALWRFVTSGDVPLGVVLRPAP
jgi:transposase